MGLLASSTSAFGQPATCGPYRVALYEYGSLAFSVDGQGAAGIDVDLLQEVSRRTGCKFQTFMDSRVRTWTDLAQGKLDMTVSAIEADERDRFSRFVIYMKGRNRLLVRTDPARPIRTLQEFTQQGQLRLAVVKGFKHGRDWDEWIDTLRQQGRVDEYADANMAARLVALGRNAAFISEPVVWARILATSKLEGKVSTIDAFPTDNYAAGFAISRSRVREEDARKIQAAVSDMRADGSLYRIFSSHLPPAEALASVP
ncbi:substrate-binding periplasmic protein [Burkholderiaceae bacterium UC74_6]